MLIHHAACPNTCNHLYNEAMTYFLPDTCSKAHLCPGARNEQLLLSLGLAAPLRTCSKAHPVPGAKNEQLLLSLGLAAPCAHAARPTPSPVPKVSSSCFRLGSQRSAQGAQNEKLSCFH